MSYFNIEYFTQIKIIHTKIFLLLIISSLLLYFISNSLSLTIYLIVSILIALVSYRRKRGFTNVEKVNELRKRWFGDIITSKLKEIDLFSYKLSYHISSNLELSLDDYYKLELSNLPKDRKPQFTIPDLTFSEKELIDQETRISKTLVLIVFVPMIFFFFHSSFQFTTSFMMLNALNTLILIEFGTYQMRNPITLSGWNKLYHDLTEVQKLVVENPFELIYTLRDYFQNLYSIELSLPSKIIGDKTSIHSFKQLIKVILDFDPFIREYLLTEFLMAIKEVVVIESIHEKKWEAYRMQFVYVTSSIILFLAILSSIFSLYTDLSSLYLSDLDIKLMSLTTIPLLSEMTLVITLSLIYFLSQPYFNNKDQLKFLLLWGFEYVLIKLILDYMFVSMIM